MKGAEKVTELLGLGWTIMELELVETFSVEDAGM